MRVADIVTASVIAPLVAAHGSIEGAPKFFGLPKQLRASNPFAGHQARHVAHPMGSLNARQEADPDRCGPEFENQVCAESKCCSGSVCIHVHVVSLSRTYTMAGILWNH